MNKLKKRHSKNQRQVVNICGQSRIKPLTKVIHLPLISCPETRVTIVSCLLWV